MLPLWAPMLQLWVLMFPPWAARRRILLRFYEPPKTARPSYRVGSADLPLRHRRISSLSITWSGYPWRARFLTSLVAFVGDVAFRRSYRLAICLLAGLNR